MRHIRQGEKPSLLDFSSLSCYSPDRFCCVRYAHGSTNFYTKETFPMLHFDSDYMEGAHPSILEALNSINFEQNPGYGTDAYCASAKEKIRKARFRTRFRRPAHKIIF